MSLLEDQQEALDSNVTFCVPLWHMVAKDGTVAAYAEGGDGLIEYDGITFYPATMLNGRPVTSTGLEPDTSELRGGFDSIITKANMKAGKWSGADIYRQILVNQLNLSLGSVRKQKGRVGSIEPLGNSYKISFESQVAPLSQKIGDLTSNSDRIHTLEGLIGDVSSFTHAATVSDVDATQNRRVFKVGYDAIDDEYFMNGRAEWITGANAGEKMEIKSGIRTDTNTKTEITLHLPMESEIEVGDTLNLIRGYKGTREDAVAIGDDAILNTNFEPDMLSEGFLIRYPE